MLEKAIEHKLTDTFNRPLRDLRISITDRCNFRCGYCMPREVFGHHYNFLPKEELLTFEEIVQLAKVFVGLGVRKIRLTGGEPLLRKGVGTLVSMLSPIPDIDLAMTTNGSVLAEKAAALRQAGLNRLTVSLDALDPKIFETMNDVVFPVQKVLDGIQAAEDVGFAPLKINMVVKRGVNESEIIPLVDHFRNSGHILRFIEFMDVGTTNQWKLDDVVSAKEILGVVNKKYPVTPINSHYYGEVATRYLFDDGAGEIGIIASVTQPFCGDCTRLRVSARGRMYTCLFSANGHDLRTILREDASNQQIIDKINVIWQVREDRYSELRTSNTTGTDKVEMSYIGG